MQAIEVSFPGGKKVAASYRGFEIVTDQPVAAGGENAAPAPFDLFLVSLGACAGYFVLSFCQTRGISTEGIRLEQRWTSDPETHMVERMTIEIRLPNDFPEKYRAAVVRAADLCTVKRHLQKPPQIEVIAS